MGRLLDAERLRRMLESLKTSIANAVAKLPAHQDFLATYCAPAD
jgi:tryptophan halogenase